MNIASNIFSVDFSGKSATVAVAAATLMLASCGGKQEVEVADEGSGDPIPCCVHDRWEQPPPVIGAEPLPTAPTSEVDRFRPQPEK